MIARLLRSGTHLALLVILLSACAAPAPPSATPAAGPDAPAKSAVQPTQVSAVPAAKPTAAPKASAGASAPKALQRIVVDFAAKSAVYGPHFIAAEKGYYAEEGLEMEMIEAAGTTGIAAVLSGESHFTTSASSSLSAILKGGAMKIIYTNADRPGYQLWSSDPDIKTLKDLQGKAVGIAGRGDTMEISTRLVLQKAGLDPNGVAYTPLGYGNARLAAVQSGSVAAAVLGVADVEQLKKSGPKGHMLSDIQNEIKMLYTGVATSDKLIQEDPELVESFLRATIKGREYFRRYRDETLDILVKYNGASRETNESDYESVLPAMTDDGSIADDVQLADAQVRGGVIGVETIRAMSEMYDYSFVKMIYDELKQSDWQPQR